MVRFFPFIIFFIYLSFFIIFVFSVPSATGQRHSLWSLLAAAATACASYYRAKASKKEITHAARRATVPVCIITRLSPARSPCHSPRNPRKLHFGDHTRRCRCIRHEYANVNDKTLLTAVAVYYCINILNNICYTNVVQQYNICTRTKYI